MVGGAGHVGVPLVLALAEGGARVNVNDINKDTLEILKSGRLPYIEYDAADLLTKALAEKRLVFTHAPEQISRGGPVIVTIGTPVDEFLNPVRRVVQSCIDSLLPHLADGQLLVLRSTVFPGTTDWLHTYLEEKGRKLKIAFCPERVVQGYGIKELREMPQIVSGTTPEAEREAAALFQSIAPEIVTRHAAGGGIRQAVQQRLSLYRIRREQRILPDRALRRPRLSAHPQCDEAQLSARAEYSASRLCRGAVPGEGHDAARGLRAQPVRARPRRHADQRRTGAACDRRSASAASRSTP